jgi:hypothetical protein
MYAVSALSGAFTEMTDNLTFLHGFGKSGAREGSVSDLRAFQPRHRSDSQA